jgi:hypothetical protein
MQSLSRTVDIPAVERSIYLAVMTESPRSMQQLAKVSGIKLKRLRRHCGHLVDVGWLRLKRVGGSIVPDDILPASAEAEVAAMLREEIEVAPYRGEAVAKAAVSWIVAPGVKVLFNVRLPEMRSPTTNQLLELDICIVEWKWAGEYHGDQHFGPTKLFSSLNDFAKRVQRDREKVVLSKKNNIRLSIITKENLTLADIDAMIPPEIPRRIYDPEGPVAQMIQELGRQVASSNNLWDRD